MLITRLIVVLAALAGLFPAAESAHAARKMEIALQDDPVFVTRSYFDRERAFRFARTLGVTRLRVNANWAYLLPKSVARRRSQPTAAYYNWLGIDSLIDAAARNGIRVHLSLTGPAPAFATSNRKVGVRAPDGRKFAEFAALAARHFRGRVDRYSIWNEPNIRPWLSPLSAAPRLYRSLYVRGYEAIKREDPNAQVLIGETSPYGKPGFSTPPIAFLRKVVCVNSRYRRTGGCPRIRADGYAHHPYEFRHSPTFRYPGADNATMGTLSHLTRALDRMYRVGALRRTAAGGGRLPLYLTEFGYFARGPRAISAKKRKAYLKKGFQLALRNSRVRSQLQYLLVSPPPHKAYAYFNTSLLTLGGGKLATYHALRSFYVRYRGSLKRPEGPLVLPPIGR